MRERNPNGSETTDGNTIGPAANLELERGRVGRKTNGTPPACFISLKTVFRCAENTFTTIAYRISAIGRILMDGCDGDRGARLF